MLALISKKAGKVVTFEDTNDLVAFKDAVQMLNSVNSLKNKIPSDWKDYRGGLTLEGPAGNPKKAAQFGLQIGDETAKDEPDLEQLYKITAGFINNAAYDVKRTPMKENRKQKIKEGLAELAAQAASDHEVQMARSELYKLSKYAIKLHDLLKNVSEREGLQAWQQSYITKAADYIDAVYHDIEYEKSVDAEIGDGIDAAEAEITAEPVEESAKSPYITELSQKLNKKIRRGR